MEAVKGAKVVRWPIAMDDEVRAGLVGFLDEASKPKASKRKRLVIEVSPDDAGGNGNCLPPRQPLVAIQARPRQPRDKPQGGEPGRWPSIVLASLPERVRENKENLPPQRQLPATHTTIQLSKKPPPTKMIHYVLEGRAKKIAIPGNGLLLLWKMNQNLEPLSYTDTAKMRKKQAHHYI